MTPHVCSHFGERKENLGDAAVLPFDALTTEFKFEGSVSTVLRSHPCGLKHG